MIKYAWDKRAIDITNQDLRYKLQIRWKEDLDF